MRAGAKMRETGVCASAKCGFSVSSQYRASDANLGAKDFPGALGLPSIAIVDNRNAPSHVRKSTYPTAMVRWSAGRSIDFPGL